jgi:MFS family permease
MDIVVTSFPQVSTFVRDRFTWLAYLLLAYYGYLQAALGPLMPFLRAELDLNYTVGGFHFSAFALGMVLAGLTGDRFAGRWGRASIFWGGAIGMAAGAIGFALAQKVAFTITAAFLMGFLGTLLLVMIQAALSDHHGHNRAIALTEANVAASLSAMLVPIMIGFFQRIQIGWRLSLVIPVIALALIAWRFHNIDIPDIRRVGREKADSLARLPFIYWTYWLVIVIGVAIEWCLVFWGAEYLANAVGLTKTAAATAMSAFFLAMVIGRYSGSRLTRRFPTGKLLFLALVIALIGFGVFWLVRLAPLSLIGLFVAGLGVSNLYPLTLSLCTSVASEQADKASARITLGTGSAIFIAPFVLGWTADQLGIANAFAIVALLIFIALGTTFTANRIAIQRQSAADHH